MNVCEPCLCACDCCVDRVARRRDEGRVRLPKVWLTAEEHAALESLREGRGVRDTLGELVLVAARDRAERRRLREDEDRRYAEAMAKLWGLASDEP